jgi:hypothetical protein
MSARSGTVFLRDFDEGLVRTMGGELVEIELDGELVQDYVIAVDGVTGPDEYNGKIPIIWQNPEDAYQKGLLPSITVARTSVTPAMQRWFPGGYAYRTPAATSRLVTAGDGRQGPSALEFKSWAYPYDITYELHLRARLRGQADRMLKKVGKKYWAYGQIYLIDSEGAERGYYAFQESIDSLDEVADVADRTVGWTISLRCEGELDFNDPYIAKTSPNVDVSVESKT